MRSPDGLSEGLGSLGQPYPQDLKLDNSLGWFWMASDCPVVQSPGCLPGRLGEGRDVPGSAEVDGEVGAVHVSDSNSYCITHRPGAQLRVGRQRRLDGALHCLEVQQKHGVKPPLLVAQGQAAFFLELTSGMRALVLESSLVQCTLLGDQPVGTSMLCIHTFVSELPFVRNLLVTTLALLFDLLTGPVLGPQGNANGHDDSTDCADRGHDVRPARTSRRAGDLRCRRPASAAPRGCWC